jgi:hypothetical protein
MASVGVTVGIGVSVTVGAGVTVGVGIGVKIWDKELTEYTDVGVANADTADEREREKSANSTRRYGDNSK